MDNLPVELLRRYIRIDTSNPPGNEYLAASFFSEIFKREGVEFKTYQSDPGRVSVRATIKGSGNEKPLILLHHMDVIAADKKEWSFNPFGGEVIDGYICGRGALDTKSLGIIQLITFLAIKHRNIKVNRDIIFLATADEESGADLGVEFLLREYPNDFEASLVLNEGSYIISGIIQDHPVALVSPGEKGPCWLKLKRRGIPGHGSIPHNQNPLEQLVKDVNRLITGERFYRVTPIVAEYFKKMATVLEPIKPYLVENTEESLLALLKKSGLINQPQVKAMLSNTISLNSIKSGDKVNVIPSYAEALLDTRILPGQDLEEWLNFLIKTLGDDELDIEIITRGPGNASEILTTSYQIIETAIQEYYPDAITAPYLMLGTTDSRFFREKGVVAYGFCPTVIPLELMGTIHGIDERIGVNSFLKGIDIYTAIVERLCTT